MDAAANVARITTPRNPWKGYRLTTTERAEFDFARELAAEQPAPGMEHHEQSAFYAYRFGWLAAAVLRMAFLLERIEGDQLRDADARLIADARSLAACKTAQQIRTWEIASHGTTLTDGAARSEAAAWAGGTGFLGSMIRQLRVCLNYVAGPRTSDYNKGYRDAVETLDLHGFGKVTAYPQPENDFQRGWNDGYADARARADEGTF